jgi:hypothetical protein
MSIDDRKRENVVNLRLTDRELLDLSRVAAVEDRKTADMAHFIVRRFLYWQVRTVVDEAEGADSASGR